MPCADKMLIISLLIAKINAMRRAFLTNSDRAWIRDCSGSSLSMGIRTAMGGDFEIRRQLASAYGKVRSDRTELG
jgi:hypothetical protein